MCLNKHHATHRQRYLLNEATLGKSAVSWIADLLLKCTLETLILGWSLITKGDVRAQLPLRTRGWGCSSGSSSRREGKSFPLPCLCGGQNRTFRNLSLLAEVTSGLTLSPVRKELPSGFARQLSLLQRAVVSQVW